MTVAGGLSWPRWLGRVVRILVLVSLLEGGLFGAPARALVREIPSQQGQAQGDVRFFPQTGFRISDDR
ncbi:MAG TPA: hypothetical protein VKY56_10820, partial [Chloroflexota bacterium]|nr:hypothetical protein [Chloroflexota bacterium]